MNHSTDLPHDIDIEKQLLSALLMRNGEIVPAISEIVSADDFYRPEHQIIFRVILRLHAQGTPPNLFFVFEELRKLKINIELTYLHSIDLATITNAYAIAHAEIIREKSNQRRLIRAGEVLIHHSQLALRSSADIIAEHQLALDAIGRSVPPSNKTDFNAYLANFFRSDIADMKAYANRKTGFANLDEHQFFAPGLYVLGATPAAGKTTFCWQLLEQLARQGETCIFCSYEMSRLELFSKSLAKELFRNDRNAPTSAQLRRGATFGGVRDTLVALADLRLNLSVLELQDESVDELLKLLRPLCGDRSKAPVVCLDYLQIMPTGHESAKLGIDDAVRKLKKFQRDTNTTFIVISSFNRMNYAQAVSFESFKESGNIEYTADVIWALQLDITNQVKGNESVSELRRKIEALKKRQPRQIQLQCLKNRQGTNYECFFEYHSAHDCFLPCNQFGETDFANDDFVPPPTKSKQKSSRRIQ